MSITVSAGTGRKHNARLEPVVVTLGATAKRDKKYWVPAVQRTFAILETISLSDGGLSPREISVIHQLPYSTVFYLLETLAEGGYIECGEDGKRYHLGHRLFTLVQRANAPPSPDLRRIAKPFLSELVSATGLTGHIAILEADEVIYIEKQDAPGLVRLNTWVGKRNTPHSTSVGKALLMHKPEGEVRRLLPASKLRRKTQRTIIGIERLLEELAKSRIRGYAVDDREDGPESRCVAAPIFDSNGEVFASIGVVGVFNQIDARRFHTFGELVRFYATKFLADWAMSPYATNEPHDLDADFALLDGSGYLSGMAILRGRQRRKEVLGLAGD